MKRNWLNLLPTIFVISIILSLIAYSAQGNTVQMNYTTFEKVAKHAKFEDSSLDIDDTVITVSGTYTDTKKEMGHKALVLLYQIPMRTLIG